MTLGDGLLIRGTDARWVGHVESNRFFPSFRPQLFPDLESALLWHHQFETQRQLTMSMQDLTTELPSAWIQAIPAISSIPLTYTIGWRFSIHCGLCEGELPYSTTGGKCPHCGEELPLMHP